MSQISIEVSAVVFRDPAGRVLTVRKRSTQAFMLPGGKHEASESAVDAAVREVGEELQIILDPARLSFLGTFTAAAANEPGSEVVATVFEYSGIVAARAAAEIAEVVWCDIDRPMAHLAPLLRDEVFPALTCRSIGAITVFTGSAEGADLRYRERVEGFGGSLAAVGVRVVYGGGKVGLMGALADSALAGAGEVVGVMPQSLVDGEIGHDGLTELEIVADMHERKMRMATLGDAFVALPGGVGTLEEFFEAWTWQQLGLHGKPLALFDKEFWSPLIAMVDHMVETGFVSSLYRDRLIVTDSVDELLSRLVSWRAPKAKWN